MRSPFPTPLMLSQIPSPMKDHSSNSFKTQRNSSLLKNLTLLTTTGISLLALVLVLGLWRTGTRLVNGVEAWFNAPPPTPQIDVSTVILQQIRGVSELTTAVFVMEAVVPASQDRKVGNLVVGTTKLLYIAHGEVRAGVHLNELDKNDIQIAQGSIKVNLPQPKIIDSKIDVNRSSIYHYDRGFLGLGPDVGPQLQILAQRETLQRIVTNACQKGLLEDANIRAKLTVKELLKTAGYSNVEVTTTAVSPQSCQSYSLPSVNQTSESL